jgi:hypothetical protein
MTATAMMSSSIRIAVAARLPLPPRWLGEGTMVRMAAGLAMEMTMVDRRTWPLPLRGFG